MRREDFSPGTAFIFIMWLAMGGAIGAALHGRAAIGEELDARTAARDSSAGAAPVILEVIATDKRAHAPVEGLTRDDFEIMEGRSVTQITSFAHGSEGSLRPLSLCLVVQCPEEHSYSNWVSNGSGIMKGKTATLTPVLKKLNERDTVGVAHWCDNGEVGVDLLPSTDRVAPQNVLDAVLNTPRTSIAAEPGVSACAS